MKSVNTDSNFKHDCLQNVMKRYVLIVCSCQFQLGAQFEEKSPTACMNFYFLPGREPDAHYPNIMDAITRMQILIS